jgi:RNA methyltransferase, TrmH family
MKTLAKRFRTVESKQNSRLKELRRALSHSGRQERGPIGLEGPNLLKEALRTGLSISCIFVAQGAEHLLEGMKLPPETELLLVPRELLDSVLNTETPQPVAALAEPPAWTWEQLLGGTGKTSPLIVILAGLQDPGNVGTILRSAEAFGAQGVLSLPGTVSAWNPKAVRASAGSVFRVPLLAASAEDCFAHLRTAGVKIFSTAADQAEPADRIDLTRPVAFMIGNEGNGVPPALAAQADGAVTIPCPGPVESLNAAVAAGVLLYEASRQRTGSHAIPSHPSQNARRMGHPKSSNGSAQ